MVIAHLNQPELLGRCLAALEVQSFDMARAEIIVVDNGSRVLPEAVVGRFPGVTLAQEPVPGPGPARNRGVALARAPLLAFTDADCLPDPGWLSAIHARFAADPGLEILGGEVEIFPETPGDITAAEAFQMLYAYRQELYITRQNFSVTANMVIRRAVFAAVGPFAGLEMAEDVDWGRRATALGPPHRLCPGGPRPAPRPPQHGRTAPDLGPPRDAFLPPGRPGPGRAAPLGADHPAHGAVAACGDPGDPRRPRARPRASAGWRSAASSRSGSTAPSAWPPCWRAGPDGAPMRWNR